MVHRTVTHLKTKKEMKKGDYKSKCRRVHSTDSIIIKNRIQYTSHYNIIESVDSVSRDERDAPLTKYITNAGITRARYYHAF